jgi:UDP-N-acetyl-alpha-D-muramoyl-L-alanyl-L-glutamate epimerase
VLAFTLNANMALKRLVETTGVKNVFIERKIDKKIIELNKEGFLNGHTPFSSILSILGAVLAVLFNCKYIAISQERSSNEGNVEYLGRIVNHQYSKTLEFENKFRKYCQKYIATGLDYFSSLRPLYELQVTKIFSRYPQYFSVFLSCNKDSTVLRRENNINIGWCGNCPKCLCIFAMLYPFVGEKEIISIFGQNLFDNEKLLPIMMELVGEGTTSFKPFECVGTIRETLTAFYLSFKKAPAMKPYLLKMFEELVLPKYPEIDKQVAQTIEAWTDEHNIPEDLAKLLKSKILI